MRVVLVLFVKLLWLTLLLSVAVVVDAQQQSSLGSSLHARIAESKQNPCKLYLAPSHLSQEKSPKYGLYAGVAFQKNEIIPNYEIALPLADFVEGPHANSDDNADIIKKLESAFWTSDYAGGAKYEGNHSSTVLVPGVGSLAHYHSGLANIEWLQASTLLRNRETITEPGKFHPSRGAITPYSNLTMKASVKIPAYMELYANFGDVWDETKNVDVYEQTISRWDYKDADKVLESIIWFLDENQDNGLKENDQLSEDIIDLILERILSGDTVGKRAKAIRSLIPPSIRKIRQVKEVHGGTFNYRNRDMVKTKSWLKKNGVCVDNIKSGISNIPSAGRGAFATRNIKKGDTISISPMLFIANDEVMNMYSIKKNVIKEASTSHGDDDDENSENEEEESELVYEDDKLLGQQVLVNYAYAHWQSSMLLVPLAPGVNLINHAPEDENNAEFDWSFHKRMPNDPDVHEKTVDEMRDMETPPSIVMQITAKRDIAKGDEITINYGEQWEGAWEDYKNFYEKVHAEGKWPLKAEDVLETYKDKPFPTDIQPDEIPYPQGVVTACYIEADDPPDGAAKVTDDNEYDVQVWIGPKNYEDYQGQQLTVCDLVSVEESQEHKYVYNVRARLSGNDDIVQVNGVPHAAVTLKDSPYLGDIHAPGVFRRWIGIPDSRFPQAWRNLRE